MKKINDYINNTETTFARFALSLGIRNLLPDTFEYMPYLLKNASAARRKINDLLEKPNTQGAIKAQKFLDNLSNNRHFVMLDSTLNLSELYSEWEDLLPVEVDHKSQQSQSTGEKDILLPAQLQPIAIKTPIQRSKLYEKLKNEGVIDETTAEDCFNWALGSNVKPAKWMPIHWTLKNTKEKVHSSALREFLVLLLYDNVCKSNTSPQNLSSKQKEIASGLFVGENGAQIPLSNPKTSDYNAYHQGYTTHHKTLKNYIYIAKNAK